MVGVHQSRVSIRFVWRCVRIGMWRHPCVGRLVYRSIASGVPIVKRRIQRTPQDIMYSAAKGGSIR
jgi:hypothetical protein